MSERGQPTSTDRGNTVKAKEVAQGSVDGVEDSLCGVALIGWTSDWRRSDSRAQWPAEDAETAIVRTRRCASAIRTPSFQSRGKVQLNLVCFDRELFRCSAT